MLDDPVFQQDDAKIHTGENTMAWFEEHRVQVVTWPANMPNMNLIKHVCKKLEERTHKRFPEIYKTPSSPARVRRALAEALTDTWREEIEGDFLEMLWESIPRGAAALLEAKGWHTKS